MIKGRVLVIDGDEWLAALLAKLLRDTGYEVDVCAEARAGFELACKVLPDCIICAVDLPDIDGFWVARRIRTEQGFISLTPFLFLTNDQDKEQRLQGLQVGADVYLQKPFTNEEVVAQVHALIQMARRLRERRDSYLSGPSSSNQTAAFRGDLSQFPLATLLMMLEMERRSGRLAVVAPSGTKAVFELAAGMFILAKVDEEKKPPLEVLREVLSWRSGRYWFRTKGSIPPPSRVAPRESVGALVLEAMRLEDEEREAGKKQP
ncbi:MAG: response regulator [Myxococcales bacterium]|nr:response regulator [Myxococcales bacterium]